MRFVSAQIEDMDRVRFRTLDSVEDAAGFSVFWERAAMLSFPLEKDADGFGAVVRSAEYFELCDSIEIYCADGSRITAQYDESVYDKPGFLEKYGYSGELGCVCRGCETVFRLWSPPAACVKVNLYENNEGPAYAVHSMTRLEHGVFELRFPGNLSGVYYTYTALINADEETFSDPFAKACGINGHRSMALDLSQTDPEGFDKNFHVLPQSQTDAVIYEISVRDFTVDKNSGISPANRGKFLGFTEEDTKSPWGDASGVAHLKELGITHVHLLPVMDFATVDESKPEAYNWGYDPVSYFYPDGAYSSNPWDGSVRVREFKQLVHSLHKNGIGVVLDVVYNHTYFTEKSNLNKSVPNYFHRRAGGKFTDGSGCGNEIRSEGFMARKLILDSILYWVKEYAIDGFRFDLMGLIDIKTINLIRRELDKIDPRIIMYGEGWTGGPSSLPFDRQPNKFNSHKMSENIGLFNDEFRDALKGDTFDARDRGYALLGRDAFQNQGLSEKIKAGIVAQTNHPHVHYSSGMHSWALSPCQTVTYHSSHDNYTLHDKLMCSVIGEEKENLEEIYKFCAGLMLSSQGIAFLLGGEEFMRSKPRPDGALEHNSYNSPDSVNKIDWELKSRNRAVFDYYKGLIALRREHPAFRIGNNEILFSALRFIYTLPNNRIAYIIDGGICGDSLSEIAVVINPTTEAFDCELAVPGGASQLSINNFDVYADKTAASSKPLYALDSTLLRVEPVSVYILGR
ncbi:MAG: type I pullulanase [Oscillospiraceae bacterium]|jgi:pullulanase|nr:type I pullulanase [Oscillospiraceae bacterium]